MVAAVSSWHQHHPTAAHEIEQRLTRGEGVVIAAPALVEAYSVLTRMPHPNRLSPQAALTVLRESFVNRAEAIAALDSNEYLRLILGAPERQIAGGSTYDAVIVACALKAKVDTLLTFNERHFRALAEPGIDIVVPT